MSDQPPGTRRPQSRGVEPPMPRWTARDRYRVTSRLERMARAEQHAAAFALALPAASNRRRHLDTVRALNENGLRAIVDTHGWPDMRAFGMAAATNAVKILCSSRDPDFLRTCRDLVRDAVLAGTCQLPHYAFVADRHAVLAGQPQTYATQINPATRRPYPVRDPEATNDLRAAAGLPPLPSPPTALSALSASSRLVPAGLVVAPAVLPPALLRKAAAGC
ncbi:hypothetical protein GCM10010371_63760 [Streptomyces subrutilus]|uniref:Uncharacterized protein n=1 Tax=Streptomyces subrutilus TaxID=36818 RepID=A0A918VG09_9ACTN|nr:DUF6624 domain-containing protein [Streptomyces subrutilus]GGZ95110.1 hypothetical protein GCM10010371_63760 [Streptomyces subrutilus]